MKTTVAWIPMLLCALALRGGAETFPPPAPASVPSAAGDVEVVVVDAEDEWGDFSGPEMAEWHQPAPETVPVLHYTFGKSGKSVRIQDRSGHGNNGTAARPLQRVPGIAKGKWAARFDGVSDYIRVPRSPSLEPEELTVDVWVRIDGHAPDFKGGTIVFKRNSGTHWNEGYCLELFPDRSARMTVSHPPSPEGQARLDTLSTLAPDLWHHLAMTFRRGEAVVYLDGKESVRMQRRTDKGGALAALDHYAAADLFIGARDHATVPLGGFGAFDLAELRIWPKALDAKRIAALYGKHAGQPGVAKPLQNKACLGMEALCPAAIAAESLVLHLAPSPSCKTTAKVRDRSGRNNHGTASRPLHRVRDGDWRAWRFDSAQRDFIRIPRSPSLEPKAITVAAWVRVPGGIKATDAGAVIFKRNTSFTDNEGYNLEILPDRRVRMTIGHSGGQKDVISRAALAPDRWHHVAMTFLDGAMRLYVDGEPAGEGRFIQALDHNPATDLLIGGRDHASHPMDRFAWFDLADLRIWSKALDAKQIASLYGEFADHPAVAQPMDTRMPVPPARTNDRPFICGTPFLPPTNAVRGIRKDALVLHYAFRTPKDGTELRDRSGHQANGITPKPLEWVRGPGNLGGALRFDGREDYIRVPRSPSMEANVVTVAAWVKLDSSRPMIKPGGSVVFKRNPSLYYNEDYQLEICSNRTVMAVCTNPSGVQSKAVSSHPIEPDVWHHLAMTIGGGRICLYIDGETVADTPCADSLNHNPEADLFIGAKDHVHYPIDHPCPMELADVRIWSAVLNDAEIAALYREKYLFGDVARPGKDQSSTPPRVFPQWQPPVDAGKGQKPAGDLAAELRLLLAQGRRDQAASPEFLDALQNLLDRHTANAVPPPPSDRLPFRPDFLAPDMPPGWSAIKPDVWRFGAGFARQIRSWANDRFVLSYDSGRKWTDYTVTFCVESDAWFTPPARSSCVLYFRYRGPGDSFSLWLEGAGDLTLASHEREGHQRILARIPVDPAVIRDGKPWTVTVRGDEIQVWHKGERLMYATDPAHPAGTIGLESVHIPARFTKLSVTAGARPPSTMPESGPFM